MFCRGPRIFVSKDGDAVMSGIQTTWAKMHIWELLAVKDQYRLRYIYYLTHVANAIALLLELDQLLGRNDRHGGFVERVKLWYIQGR
jgi:hypothetical protein